MSERKELRRCRSRVSGNDIIYKHNRIDVLFNSVGILIHGTSEVMPAEINKLLKIKLNGQIYFSNFVSQKMKIQNSGYIFNVSSIAAENPRAFTQVLKRVLWRLISH